MPKTIEMELRTTFKNGHECVDRNPPFIHTHKANIDVVRITNKNPSSGSSITVIMDPDTLGNLFRNPPLGPHELSPGESMDLKVKETITSEQAEGFTTDPQSCQHHDSGDLVIQP